MKRILSLTLLSLVLCNTFGMDLDPDLNKQTKTVSSSTSSSQNQQTKKEPKLSNGTTQSVFDLNVGYSPVFNYASLSIPSHIIPTLLPFFSNKKDISRFEAKYKSSNQKLNQEDYQDSFSSFVKIIATAKQFEQEKEEQDQSEKKEKEHKPIGRYIDPKEKKEDREKFKNSVSNLPVGLKETVKVLKVTKSPKLLKHRVLAKKVLLHGIPGVGKTFAAKAIAYEIGRRCYHIRTSDFLTAWQNYQEHVGSEIDFLIKQGEPLIVLLDEIDEITKKDKTKDSSDSSGAKKLWQWLDTAQEEAPYLAFIGTSNNHEGSFPKALTSRFKSYEIKAPDAAALKKALQLYIGDFDHSLTDQDFTTLSESLVGRGYRDMENIVDEAYGIALSEDDNYSITLSHMNQSIERNPIKPSNQEIAKEFVSKKFRNTEERMKYIQKHSDALDDQRKDIQTYYESRNALIQERQAKQASDNAKKGLVLQALPFIKQMIDLLDSSGVTWSLGVLTWSDDTKARASRATDFVILARDILQTNNIDEWIRRNLFVRISSSLGNSATNSSNKNSKK